MKARSRRLPDECNVRFVCICAKSHNLLSKTVTKINHAKSVIQCQVDQLVHELYDLTDKEIRIVVEGTE